MRNQARPITIALGILLVCTSARPLCGTPVKEEKARQVIERWVRDKTADRRANASIEKVEQHRVGGQTTAFVVHLKDGGYCIGGADTLTLPVYWYCPNGRYDPKNPGCQEILHEISRRAAFLRDETAKGGARLGQYKQALKHRATLWEELSSSQSSPAGCPPAYDPTIDPTGPFVLKLPLTSTWDQGAPYNVYCPAAPAGSDNHVFVGCVATAMAQIMKYWRWPNTGEGSAFGSYGCRSRIGAVGVPFPYDLGSTSWNGGKLTWDGTTLWMSGGWDDTLLAATRKISTGAPFQTALDDLYSQLTTQAYFYVADFGSTTYRWDLLQDSHGEADAGGREAAKISFHAGVAVGMSYGLAESGAYEDDIPDALVDHFRYDSDADSAGFDSAEIANEIEWLRPCFMTGRMASDGHCWVVYGYNKGTSPWQFRMNMGWGGDSDGWYSVDCVPYDFNDSQGQVTKVAPAGVVRFVGADSSGDGTPDSPYRNLEEAAASAADHTTLILRANSMNSFSSPALFINRPLTLKGINVTIAR